MVLSYKELHSMARPDCLFFSSTVCGGLPVVNVGRRDISCTGAEFEHVRGVFNSTSNYILKQMGEGGTFDDALATAQVSLNLVYSITSSVVVVLGTWNCRSGSIQGHRWVPRRTYSSR